MKEKKKLNRKVHGEGQKSSPKVHRLSIYLYNPPRKGSITGRGSKDFKTTHTFKEIETMEKALEIINQFAENSAIKKAEYNGKLIISENKWIIDFNKNQI